MADSAHELQTNRRMRLGCGAGIGALVGFLFAPRIQWRGGDLGVDPYAVVPAVVIVLCTALIGALLVARGKRH